MWFNRGVLDAQSTSIRQTTGVHEMGHVLGLGHDYESGCTISIMQADANIVIPCGRQSPGSEDLRGITRIYSQ